MDLSFQEESINSLEVQVLPGKSKGLQAKLTYLCKEASRGSPIDMTIFRDYETLTRQPKVICGNYPASTYGNHSIVWVGWRL